MAKRPALFLMFAITSAMAKQNVLFIIVEDLRPELGAYGSKGVHTPNIDELAENSLLFERAYCQQAICAPSRTSLFTGRRPDTIRMWNHGTDFRKEEKRLGQHWITLPQHFKRHGYFTTATGKVLHTGFPANFDPPSWSNIARFPVKIHGKRSTCPNETSWCLADNEVSAKTYNDAKETKTAIERIRYGVRSGKPFFVAVGYHGPQMPYRFPEFISHELLDVDKVPLAHRRRLPKNLPDVALRYTNLSQYGDLTNYSDLKFMRLRTTFPKAEERRQKWAFYGAVILLDIQVGRLLDELKRIGIENDTIVVITADHGIALGESSLWKKQMNTEAATRVPLIIRAPKEDQSHGKRISTPVELIDVYPTLVDLAGLPKANETLDGRSLKSMFDHPAKEGKGYALSQFPRCPKVQGGFTGCLHKKSGHFKYMGYSLRTRSHRYTEWVTWNMTTKEPSWANVVARELYAYKRNDYEVKNVADAKPGLVKRLSKRLHQIARGE
eukprot:m.48733 g.48733  ORF g.48733 m.48733 type:complete len:497 (+) comp33920_c0_seq1:244-1734(+)